MDRATTHQTRGRFGRRAATLALAGLMLASAGLALSGCRGDRSGKPPRQFFPDMDNQPKYQAQQRSTFFTEYFDEETGERFGRTQRLPVSGTVPFGRTAHVRYNDGVISELAFGGNDYTDRVRLGRTDAIFLTGKPADSTTQTGDASGDWVEFIPIEVDRDLVDLGKDKYNIYCLPCHGGLGVGDGTVGERWAYDPANLQGEQYLPGGEKGKDGHLFDVILNGVPLPGGPYPYAMRGYRGKVTEHEAWAIVAYIRVLQQSQRGTPEMLPRSQREALGDASGGGAGVGSPDGASSVTDSTGRVAGQEEVEAAS